MQFFYVKNIFDLQFSDNETTTLSKSLEICTKMHFVSLFFLNERNILVIQLKCTVVHYVDLRSSSIIFKLRAVEYASPFFSICYLSLFQRGSCEKLLKKIFIFNTHFQNSSQDVGYYRILGCQTLWY